MVFLSKYGVALRHGTTADATVTLSKRVQKVVVKARGTSPFPQSEAPVLDFAAYTTTDTLKRQPLWKAQCALTRSQAGLMEYELPCSLDPGRYLVTVRAMDVDKTYLIDLEGVKFK